MVGTHERLSLATAPAYWYYEHKARYEFSKRFARDKRIIDIGCGTGYGTLYLAQVASWAVGIDIDKETICQAEKQYQKENLQFVVMDGIKLAFPDSIFDFVCSFEVIEHIEKQKEYICEIKRTLRNNGILMISTPNRITHPFAGLNPHHYKEFSPGEFESFLSSFFREVEIYGERSETKAMRLYHFPIMRMIFGLMALLGLKLLVPSSLTRVQRLVEELATGHLLNEAKPEEFRISKGGLDQSDTLVAVCVK